MKIFIVLCWVGFGIFLIVYGYLAFLLLKTDVRKLMGKRYICRKWKDVPSGTKFLLIGRYSDELGNDYILTGSQPHYGLFGKFNDHFMRGRLGRVALQEMGEDEHLIEGLLVRQEFVKA